jgi:hypothetical protein
MSGIFNSAIFNNAIFNTGDAGAVVTPDVVETGTGGIDGDAPKRRIVKPTGLLHLPKKKEGRKDVGERVDESQAIQAEIAARLAREFGEDNAARAEIERLEFTRAEADAEIGRLLRKKIRSEEDDIILMLLMAAAAA